MGPLRPKITAHGGGPVSLLSQFAAWSFSAPYLFCWWLAELLCLLPCSGVTQVLPVVPYMSDFPQELQEGNYQLLQKQNRN